MLRETRETECAILLLPECATRAVFLVKVQLHIAVTLWSCSSTCPGVIAPSPVMCGTTTASHRWRGHQFRSFIWMWRAVSSFLVCFVIECAPWLACRLYGSVLSFYCLLLFNCPVFQKVKKNKCKKKNLKKLVACFYKTLKLF